MVLGRPFKYDFEFLFDPVAEKTWTTSAKNCTPCSSRLFNMSSHIISSYSSQKSALKLFGIGIIHNPWQERCELSANIASLRKQRTWTDSSKVWKFCKCYIKPALPTSFMVDPVVSLQSGKRKLFLLIASLVNLVTSIRNTPYITDITDFCSAMNCKICSHFGFLQFFGRISWNRKKLELQASQISALTLEFWN